MLATTLARNLCALNLVMMATPMPAQDAPQPQKEFAFESRTAVRRFSIGGTMSFLPVNMISGGTRSSTRPTPPEETVGDAESTSSYFGGGVSLQLTLTRRTALNTGLLWRNASYLLTSNYYSGADNPNTSTDERSLVTTFENTRATYWDVPLLFRRYSKDHSDDGQRWFWQGGASLRTVRNIRSSRDLTAGQYYECCDTTPASPAAKTIYGATVGAGYHLIDDFGIKLVPEVRYTHWFGRTFDLLSARSRRGQVEVLVSFMF